MACCMTDILTQIFFFALAYFIGSIPSGIIVARAMKLTDPRSVGSGNIGATNMVRAGGKIAGLITLLLDASKAVASFFICNQFTNVDNVSYVNVSHALWIGLATLIGHSYPVWLKFKGGKGVATGLGLIAVIHLFDQPQTAYLLLIFVTSWVGMYKLTKIVSVASLVTFAIFPLFAMAQYGVIIAPILISALIFLRHAENITRLLRGEEHAFKRS
jgi:acyl phosphate:glycerol-3-phosphate acyltransferase